MTIEEAMSQLQDNGEKYLVMGIRSDGRKGIPPTYEMVYAVVPKEASLDAVSILNTCRVFSLTEIESSPYWKEAGKRHSDKKMEMEEKALLKKLKEKYEVKES